MLSVILIMLFFVMMQSSQQSENYREKADEEIAAAQAQTPRSRERTISREISFFVLGNLLHSDSVQDVSFLPFGKEKRK